MITAAPERKQPDVPIIKRDGLHTCKKCGGMLARDYEDITCINCGALHDENGGLLEHRMAKLNKVLIQYFPRE